MNCVVGDSVPVVEDDSLTHFVTAYVACGPVVIYAVVANINVLFIFLIPFYCLLNKKHQMQLVVGKVEKS